MSYTVRVGYDIDERIYYVLSSDIPGLNVETDTLDLFFEVVTDAFPELIPEVSGATIRFEREIEFA